MGNQKSESKEKKKVQKISTLSAKNELALLKIAKNGPTKIARIRAAKMIMHYNRNLVIYIVKGYSFANKSQTDIQGIIAEGINALRISITKFDINSGKRFGTYAGFWIRQNIQACIHKDQLISQPTNQQKKKNMEFDEESEEIDKNNKEENNLNPVEKNKKKFVREGFGIVYLDKYYTSNDKDSKPYRLADIIGKENSSQEDWLFNNDMLSLINKIMLQFENKLESFVFRLYFGIVPINMNDYLFVCDEEENQKLLKTLETNKYLKGIDFSLINHESPHIKNNKIIKKYLKYFSKPLKTREISEIFGKPQGIIRKMRLKVLKKIRENEVAIKLKQIYHSSKSKNSD